MLRDKVNKVGFEEVKQLKNKKPNVNALTKEKEKLSTLQVVENYFFKPKCGLTLIE